MIAGLVLMLAGFIVMSMETATHGFGFLGLDLGPWMLVAAFGIQFWAIFYKEKKEDQTLGS